MNGLRALALILASLTISVGCRAQSLPTASAEQPVGFGRATTGACQGGNCICRVTRLDDAPRAAPGTLRACAESGGRWTVFEARGVVRLKRPLRVASNTTIDGRPLANGDAPVTISGDAPWLMLVEDSDNVIIRDLYFRVDKSGAPARCANPRTPRDTVRCGVPLYVRGDARNIWINHNDFDRCGEKCIAVWNDRDRDQAGRATAPDLMTISNNRFTNSYYGITIGSGAALSDRELPQTMRITINGNLFSNVFRRSPRAAANAQVHAFNNLVRHWGRPGQACRGAGYGFAASSVGEAELFLENNVFEPWPGAVACKNAGEADAYEPREGHSRGVGRLRGAGNLLLSGGRIDEQFPERVFDPANANQPATHYPYQLRPVAGLAEQIAREAGVRYYPRPPLQ